MPSFKKIGGKIFDVKFSAKEQAVMDAAIKKRVSEISREHSDDFDTMVLYVLHTEFGYGKDRCRKFYDLFTQQYTNLLDHYELGAENTVSLCADRLKADGIDIRAWNAERAGAFSVRGYSS